MRISVDVRPSASVSLLSGSDRGRFTDMSYLLPDTAVLIVNSPPVKPNVVVEVSADIAAPMFKITGELGAEGGRDGEGGAKLLSLRDLGIEPPPAARDEGSDLKGAFEKAASELIYRLDLLRKINVGRDIPVVVSVNL